MDIIVVTRHKALYDYLVLEGIVPRGTVCISRATEKDVQGKHVFGVMPYWLASKAGLYTEIQMRLPSTKKGRELTIEDIRFLSIRPVTYTVKEIINGREQTSRYPKEKVNK